MCEDLKIEFREMKEEDIESLTPIMKSAFDYDAKIHLGEESGGPNGYDDGSFLRNWGLHENSTSYCIYLGEVLVGGTVLWINENNENYLGCLFIDVDYEDKGIGMRVWNKIEEMYPETKIWRTETPIFSRRNHNFYINKCGFHLVKIENPKDWHEGSFLLEKVIK